MQNSTDWMDQTLAARAMRELPEAQRNALIAASDDVVDARPRLRSALVITHVTSGVASLDPNFFSFANRPIPDDDA